MADAQDLKSWGLKQPCGFESHHRHQLQGTALQSVAPTRLASASKSASEIETRVVLNQYSARTWQQLEMTGLAARLVYLIHL